MRKEKAKTVKKKRSQPSWDNLIVASIDSLPNGVFLLLMSSAKSPTAAAQRKANSIGIPGEVTVIQQHPLNRTTGKALFKETLKSLKQFPYGESESLVKSTTGAILRNYKKLSADDPNQIDLQRSLYALDVEEQLQLLKENRTKVASLSATAEQLELKVTELKTQEELLREEIDALEKEKAPLMTVVKELRYKVDQLDYVYGDLKDLAEFEGRDKDADSYWERRVLLERICSVIDEIDPK